MDSQKIVEQLKTFYENNLTETLLIVGFLIIVIVFFLFKSKKEEKENPGGMNPLEWEIFKRKKEE